MASRKHSSAFSSEVSPDHSEFEDDIDTPGDTHLRNPLSSASRPGPDDVTNLLRQMQLESEQSRKREQALLQRLAAVEQRPPVRPAPRGPTVTPSGHVTNPSVSITAPSASAPPPGPDEATTPVSSRNPSPFLAQIPDSDPGKTSYDLFGRKMAMLVALFPVPADFTRALPDFDPGSTIRFATPENRARGHTADIYALFPPKCHAGLRNSTRVQQAVIGLAGARRHLATHCIQGSFHDIFADLPEGLRNAVRTKDWTYPNATFMVQGTSKSWTKLQLCPVYYPEGRSGDPKQAFRAPWLLRLARRILYSTTALQSATQREPPRKTDGKRWDADVTAGLIAMCCILTRFAFGPDKNFTNVGDESEFDFAAAYLYLKEFILKALAQGHKWAIALLLFWRTHVLAPSVLAQVLGETRSELSDPEAQAEDQEHLRLLEEDFNGDFDGDFENFADGGNGYNSDGLGYEPSSYSESFEESTPPDLHAPRQDSAPPPPVLDAPAWLAPAPTILYATNSSAPRPFASTASTQSPTSPRNACELQVMVGGVRRTIRAPPGVEDIVGMPISAARSNPVGSSGGSDDPNTQPATRNDGEVRRVFPRIVTLPSDQPERHLLHLDRVPLDANHSGAATSPNLPMSGEFADAHDMPAVLPAEAVIPARQVKPRARPTRAAAAQAAADKAPAPAEDAIAEDTTATGTGKTVKRKSTRAKKA